MSTNIVEISESRRQGFDARQVVAANLAAELARKRISGRKAAQALGLNHVYVGRRVSGEVELSVSDLVMFASYLGIDPAVLLKTENPHSGNPNGGSVVGPAGIEPTTSTVEHGRLAEVIQGPWAA